MSRGIASPVVRYGAGRTVDWWDGAEPWRFLKGVA